MPPIELVYQSIFEPVAVKLATVVPLQNVWAAVPRGDAGDVFIVTETSKREDDSQPFTVWLA